MPVNSVQQEIARFLVSLGSYGTEAWFALGTVGAAILTFLAVLPVLPLSLRRRLDQSWVTRLPGTDGGFLLACIAFIVVLRLPGLSQLELNPDESNLVLSARTLLQDLRFWVSVEVQAIGPVSTLAVMLPGVLGMPIDYTTIKMVAIGIWCCVVVAMFFGFRSLYPGLPTRVMVLPLVLTVAAFNYWDYVAFNGEHMVVLLLALAFVLHAGLSADPSSVQPVRSFLLGAALVLIPFAKVQAGPVAVIWGVLACVLALRVQRGRVLYHVGGASFVGAVMILGLILTGAWRDFWQSYVLNNLLYASVGWNATQQDTSLLDNALYAPRYFLTPPDSRGLFLFLLLVLVASGVLTLVSRSFRAAIDIWQVALASILLLVAAYCVILPKNNWTHYLLLLFIPVSMLTASLLAAMFRSIDSLDTNRQGASGAKPGPGTSNRLLILVVVIALTGGFASAGHALLQGNRATAPSVAAENFRNGNTPNAVTAAILRHAAPMEPVAHWGMLFADLASAGVSLGTREAQNERSLHPSAQQQYYLDRWISDLVDRRPSLVVDSGTGERFAQFRLANYPREYAEVLSRYWLIEEVEGFHLYRLREVP